MNFESSTAELEAQHPDPPGLLPWTLGNGILFIQELEAFLCQRWKEHKNGALVHCALGGSVLHKALSDKDLDIFIYPHKFGYDPDEVAGELEVHYSTKLIPCDFQHDDKDVRKAYINNQRVDFFFL